MFRLARQYYLANGNLLISGDYVSEGKRLGAWIGTQRTEYKTHKNPYFTQSRINRLETIGMIWDVKEFMWQDRYQELLRYAERFGNVRVSQSYVTEDGKNLGIWVNKVRMELKAGKLSEDRRLLLEQAGMIWEPEVLRRSAWDIKYSLLKDHVKCYGEFPQADYVTERGVKLGGWFHNQKQYYKSGSLLPERLTKLEALGVVWDVAENQWNTKYGQAQEFYSKFGHLCLFSERGNDLPGGCSNWLIIQRKKYRDGELDSDKIRKLEQIGMIWDVHESVWEEKYQQARRYYLRHGHLRVSKSCGTPEERRLGNWIGTQRKNYMTGQNAFFTLERIQKLNEIGMVWDASVDSAALWEEWYQKAAAFYEKHGHLRVPPGRLETWLHAQRGAKRGKRGVISGEQIRRLEQVGISWDPIEEDWMAMYQYAKKFCQIHQMLTIPCNYVTEDGANLGIWISHQRKGYKNYLMGKKGGGRDSISPQHVKLLNDIGMIWDGSTLMSSTSFQEKSLLYYLKQHFQEVGKMDQWQVLGIELDLYIPFIRTAIEYDGCKWHGDRVEMDEKKGRICREQGITLIRMREPGLPEVSLCDLVIELEDLGDRAFDDGITRLFEYLGLPDPDHDIARDRAQILTGYRDFTSRKWDRMYQAVYQYVQEHGRLSIPAADRSGSGIRMSAWINTQREAYRNNQLTDLQIEKLERIGISWAPFEERWQYLYSLAKDYAKKHGNLMIPHDYKTDSQEALGAWLCNEREKYRSHKQTPRRINLLEQLGMVWNPAKNKQRGYMEAAGKYRERHGNLAVPSLYISEDHLRLGEWLGNQRKLQKLGKLSKKREKELTELGILWDVMEGRWEELFSAARKYFQEHGNLWMSPDYVLPNGVRLGGWVSNQRQKRKSSGKNSQLTEKQKQRLDEIGMIWDPYTQKWLYKYQEAKAFYLEHGHLEVPVDYITEDGIKLGMWLSSQRQARRGNPNFLMTPEREQLLDEIGMRWELKFSKPDAKRRKKESPELVSDKHKPESQDLSDE